MEKEKPFAVVDLLSRLFVGLIFVLSGVTKILGWGDVAGYMRAKALPIVPVLLVISILIEIIGGLALWFGVRTRTVALILLLYLIPVTLIFHQFWGLQGMERQLQFVNFLKNIAIMGGLLGIANHGAGRWSIDSSTYHRGPHRRIDDREIMRKNIVVAAVIGHGLRICLLAFSANADLLQ